MLARSAKLLFPWAEDELKKLQDRIAKIGQKAQDFALRSFLELLKQLRHIILQDMAVLYSSHPELSLFNFAPFNNNRFRDFVNCSTSIIAAAEDAARLKFNNLPSHMVAPMQDLAAS
ncbi:hypothetical protein C8J56DRAFT_1058264 [Mycena floridula]|nr:hypothetical protein C8J56DRAFT_1058264 [Mycena floridula]